MEFICLGLGYDARIHKGIQPAQTDEHPVLSSMGIIIIVLLEILN